MTCVRAYRHGMIPVHVTARCDHNRNMADALNGTYRPTVHIYHTTHNKHGWIACMLSAEPVRLVCMVLLVGACYIAVHMGNGKSSNPCMLIDLSSMLQMHPSRLAATLLQLPCKYFITVSVSRLSRRGYWPHVLQSPTPPIILLHATACPACHANGQDMIGIIMAACQAYHAMNIM